MDSVNVSIVRQAYADYASGDLGKVAAALTEDVSWQVMGQGNALATFGDRAGRSGALEYFGALSETLETRSFAPHEFVADGDKVVVVGHTTGVMKASSKPLDVDWVHVFTFKDGRISGFKEFFDTAHVIDAAR